MTISPAPAAVKTLASIPDYRQNVIAIDPYALDPRSTYTERSPPGVKDVFGQTLGQRERVVIRTPDFAPGAWAPSGTNIFPAGAPIALNFYATNLPQNRYQSSFARITAATNARIAVGTRAIAVLRELGFACAQRFETERAERRADSAARQIGGPYGALAYGFRTALDPPGSDPRLTGIVQITNLGVFAQWFPRTASCSSSI